MKIPTNELGEIQLLLIDQKPDGSWEPEWEPLRRNPAGDLVTVVAKDLVDQALCRYARPLVLALGLPPVGALRKVESASRECQLRRRCPFYKPKECVPSSPALRWCFEPDGVEDSAERDALSRAIQVWHEGVYIVVVKEA